MTMTDPATLPWQPLSPGFSLKLLHGADDRDTRALLLRLEPGTVIDKHRHHGEVHALNLAGWRKILETGEVIGPGGYVHEPAGNVDSWMAIGDEPVIVFVTVQGAMESLDERGQVIDCSTTSTIAEAYARFSSQPLPSPSTQLTPSSGTSLQPALE